MSTPQPRIPVGTPNTPLFETDHEWWMPTSCLNGGVRIHTFFDFDEVTGDLDTCEDSASSLLVIIPNRDITKNLRMGVFQNNDPLLNHELTHAWGISKLNRVRSNMIGWFNDKRFDPWNMRDIGIEQLHSSPHITVYEAAIMGRHPSIEAIGCNGLAIRTTNVGTAVNLADHVTRELRGVLSDTFEVHRIFTLLEPLAIAITRDFAAARVWKGLPMVIQRSLKASALWDVDSETANFFTSHRLRELLDV